MITTTPKDQTSQNFARHFPLRHQPVDAPFSPLNPRAFPPVLLFPALTR